MKVTEYTVAIHDLGHDHWICELLEAPLLKKIDMMRE